MDSNGQQNRSVDDPTLSPLVNALPTQYPPPPSSSSRPGSNVVAQQPGIPPQIHPRTPSWFTGAISYTPVSATGALPGSVPFNPSLSPLTHAGLLFDPSAATTPMYAAMDGRAVPMNIKSDAEYDEPDHDGDREEDRESRRGSTESARSGNREDDPGSKGISPKKRPRITLARGAACVVCRNRKLKCTGETPCKNCEKAGIECRYEEAQKRKPRTQLLEERIAQLEFLLRAKGEAIPSSKLSGIPIYQPSPTARSQDIPPLVSGSTSSKRPSIGGSSLSSTSSSVPPPVLSLRPMFDVPPNMATMNAGHVTDITPNSALEMALVTIVLPHTPHFGMPLHPQRFLASLALPAHDPQRPQPALLYVLFAEAVRVLEMGFPRPNLPRAPSIFPPSFASPMPPPSMDPSFVLQSVRGMSLAFFERSRVELDNGIRNVDRPFDLARAAIGIARYLYSLGRFIEGWAVPVSRLAISCGLHRSTGATVDSADSTAGGAPAQTQMSLSQTYGFDGSASLSSSTAGLPVLRMRPVIIPPPRDEIEVAERNMTFWAAKAQDWEAGIGWGWTTSMADHECTTQWPVGWGSVETRPSGDPYCTLADLHGPSSSMPTTGLPETTFVLALKSLALLHRSSSLFDLPVASVPRPNQSRPSHIPPLEAIQAVERSIRNFRQTIPFPFHDLVSPSPAISPGAEIYDGPADPWWIMLYANLYTAEMMMYKEMANYQRAAYETAVSCARALVKLVGRVRAEQWAHVDMVVSLDMSLAARFLHKESARLAVNGQPHGARLANEEAEMLRMVLATDYTRWLPMANLQALIIQRVREGWPEKEGEYERI